MDDKGFVLLMLGPLIGMILAGVCLGFSLRADRRRRLISNLPTSKTTGVFIGLVELKGTAEVGRPLISHLAQQPCVQFQWLVQEHWSRLVTETYTDSDGHTKTRTRTESGWTTVDSGGEMADFYLKDDCGVVLIRPEGAKIEPLTVFDQTCGRGDPLYYAKGPAGAVSDSDHRRRFTETALPLHTPLYVMGQSRERQDVVAPEIAQDPQAPMFLISTRSEEEIDSGMHGTFWGLGLLGTVCAVVGWMVSVHIAERDLVDWVPLYILVGLMYLGAWFLGWVWAVYNSMVELRQRVQQAWANVDVQLKRRNDLIPNLVSVVKGLRDYEQQLQTELARLRTQLDATPPGQPGPDPQACRRCLIAIAERYPELKANQSFLNLQKNLIDTEERISLARGYFNEIATHYNTRLQIIPDRFICALGGMQPQVLMAAEEFERAPVQVSLAS